MAETRRENEGKGSGQTSEDAVKCLLMGKQHNNGKNHKNNPYLHSVISGCLLPLVSFLLNGLVGQLEKMMHYHSWEDNSSLEQALCLMRACQKSISESFCTVSLDEQFLFIHKFHILKKSLTEGQISLEGLQSSHEVAELVTLLLQLPGSPQREGSGQQVSQEVTLLVVSAFSSMVQERRAALVQQLDVALESAFICLKNFALADAEEENEDFLGQLLDTEGNDKGKGQYLSLVLKRVYHNEVNMLITKNVYVEQTTNVAGEDTIVQEPRSVPGPNALPSIPAPPIPQRGVHYYTSSLAERALNVKKNEGPLKMKTIKHSYEKLSDKKSVPLACECDVNSDDFDSYEEMILRLLQNELELSSVLHDIYQYESQRVKAPCACNFKPYPLPPDPLTSWCWKKLLLELPSVEGAQTFIETINLNILKQCDAECHETICHAIVSVFEGDSAVCLVRALNQRSVDQFDVRDKNGDTPLHKAVVSGDLIVVKELIGLYSAAVHVQNSNHFTPLDIAKQHNKEKIIDCLLRGAAKCDSQDTSSTELCDHISSLNASERPHSVSYDQPSNDDVISDAAPVDACSELKEQGARVVSSPYNTCGAKPSLNGEDILNESNQQAIPRSVSASRKLSDLSKYESALQEEYPASERSPVLAHSSSVSTEQRNDSTLESSVLKESHRDSSYEVSPHKDEALESPPSSEPKQLRPQESPAACCSTSSSSLHVTMKNAHCPAYAFQVQSDTLESFDTQQFDISAGVDAPSEAQVELKLHTDAEFENSREVSVKADSSPCAGNYHSSQDGPQCTSPPLHEPNTLEDAYFTVDADSLMCHNEIHLHSESSQPTSLTSEASSLDLFPPAPNPSVVEALRSKRILEYSSTEESDAKRQPFMFKQQYTDSMASSASCSTPRKRSVSMRRLQQRARAMRRLAKYRLSTSGSDTNDDSKVHCRKLPRAMKKCFKRNAYESSNHSSGESSDSELSDVFHNHEVAVVVRPKQYQSMPESKETLQALPPRGREYNVRVDMVFELSAMGNALLTEMSFCSIDNNKISFHVQQFNEWLMDNLKRYGYIQLRNRIDPQLFTVFGFSPPRVKLTRIERKLARVVISVVELNEDSIPVDESDNLLALKAIEFPTKQVTDNLDVDDERGRDRNLKKGVPAKTKSAAAAKVRKEPSPLLGTNDQCDGATSVNCSNSSQPPRQLYTAEKFSVHVQEESTEDSVCQFCNANNPLDVIHSHMIHYCKCCPRHDILDTVVTGTTFPASDAFVSKKRYSTIKDITSDQRHGKLDSTKELRARTGDDRRYSDNRSRQVMLDDPIPESTRRGRLALPRNNASVAVETRLEEPHSSLLQSLHQNSSSSAQAVAQRKTPDTESRINESNGDLERKVTAEAQPQHKSLATVEHADTGYSTRSSVPSRAPQPLSTQSEPGDHKDRLRSAAELLHAQDYPRIVIICYGGEPPAHLSPHLKIPYVFITGLAYYKMSNHKKSVQYFGKCLGLAEECHRDGDVTICNIYLGDIDFAKRKYTEAAGKYQNALNQYSRDSVAKDFRMILPTKSAVWLKCGSAFKNASRVGDAVHAYESAVELAASKKDQLSARTSLGNLFQGIGENERAKIQYEEAIKLATELEDHISLGWNHGNLGNALLGLHQRDKALHHLFKALDMAVDHEMTPQAIGRAYNNLGTAFQSLNELSKAEEHYDLALAQAIYGNDIPGQARVYGNIGNLQMLNKHYDRAVPHYTEVMRLSQDKATITTAHHNRGCAYYDWAEKKKNSFFERIHQDSSVRSSKTSSSLALLGSHAKETDEVTPAASSKSSGFKISLHGPDFEHSEEVYRPMFVPEAIQKYYLQGTRDLEYVIKHHEESFNGIKGSSKGLSLSVSLFETNSRTFHRMQDCLVHLQKSEKEPSRYEDALLVAEQSRARTLGELLLRRRGPQLEHELVSPPSIHQLKSVVARQSCPVVYLSYTGERLMGWILYPTCNNHCSVNMFQVPLSDSEFDGKSFDYHLRYSLNEQLVEKSFEMYKPFIPEKDKTKTEPLEKLYDLVARPLMTMLKELDQQKQNHNQEEDEDCTRGKSASKPTVTQNQRKVIIIPDSYTNLLPFTCVLNKETGKFWGDEYYFQIMPSLLTMGILDQLPTVSVSIPVQHQQMLCVVGNPTIPRFKFNNDEWDLGKLPHATKEAEWVSHILQCKPILHEQATKDAVMMRLMNAKVIHLATHGSAAAGFLAFAGMNSSTNEAVDSRKVLIYPHEVESLNISPALVVLSSCDSGRGVFKADGIQGMARAFILAGAQAVLTALWRVPDESACIFMQFFYEYLVDGLRGTEALHKAILSLRCFSKYSQYIHWSGYQLTGREFQFDINHSSARAELTTRLGASSVFPRLEILNNLKNALINNPRPPSDVQVLHGPPGVKPSEPLIDFIHCHHLHFTGGIFWINCRTQQLIEASLTAIKHAVGVKELSELSSLETQPSLVVLDSLDQFPKEDGPLLNLLKDSNRHIVIISKSNFSPEGLQKSIDRRLLRGTNTITVQPLSTIHATQRMVHSILKNHHLAPSTKQQALFERLAEFTTGSPPILDLTSSLLDQSFSQETSSEEDALDTFADKIQLTELPHLKPLLVPGRHSMSPQRELCRNTQPTRHISREVYKTFTAKESEDVFVTSAQYDSWQVTTVLIDQCNLTPPERLLLFCLSSFDCCPIPTSHVTEISTIIAKASHQPHLASSLHSKLEKNKMLKTYPKPVVCHPNLQTSLNDIDFVYIPRFIAAAVWKDLMSDVDKVMALSTCYKALQTAVRQPHSPMEDAHLLGVGSILVESYENNFNLVGKLCFQEMYTLFLKAQKP